MIKLLFISFTLLFMCGCSITYVSAPKTVFIKGNENSTAITGSDLKGNDLKQTSSFDWILQIPEKLGALLSTKPSTNDDQENSFVLDEYWPSGGGPVVRKD